MSEDVKKKKVKEMKKKKKKKAVYNIIPGWRIYGKAHSKKKKLKDFIRMLDLNKFSNLEIAQRKSLDLNIKLMNWNTSNNLQFHILKNLKILLIGLGTLGCSVIRTLIGWGIKNFTLIDNARVSFSNPARQSLYTFDDAAYNENIGEYKVIAAKKHLLKIVPDLNIITYVLDIPMPGHLNYLNTDIETTYKKLEELIISNDVVFLLTDSKESRYFPSLIIAEQQYNGIKYIRDKQNIQNGNNIQDMQTEKKEINEVSKGYNDYIQSKFYNDKFLHDHLNVFSKDLLTKEELNIPADLFFQQIIKNVNNLSKLPPLGITVALGFDSCLILRHPYLYFKSACYFCNDLNSPTDSITYRTLDQKCTVTKVGISSIGSSIAVELLISLTQHPMYFYAPHTTEEHYLRPFFNEFNKTYKQNSMNFNDHQPILTATPHIIKYNIANFSTTKLYSYSFDKCVCCSEKIIETYQEDKMAFVRNVIKNSKILEKIAKIHKITTINPEDVISFD